MVDTKMRIQSVTLGGKCGKRWEEVGRTSRGAGRSTRINRKGLCQDELCCVHLVLMTYLPRVSKLRRSTNEQVDGGTLEENAA